MIITFSTLSLHYCRKPPSYAHSSSSSQSTADDNGEAQKKFGQAKAISSDQFFNDKIDNVSSLPLVVSTESDREREREKRGNGYFTTFIELDL